MDKPGVGPDTETGTERRESRAKSRGGGPSVGRLSLAAAGMGLAAAVTAGLAGAWPAAALAGGCSVLCLWGAAAARKQAGRRAGVLEWIRRMGTGDFEYTLALTGQDEAALASVALETVRMRALRAARLGEAETLSAELREKNEELEVAMHELRQTQDRMVHRQKVAELGELSAGLAHELRNPLQFIKNFAEAAAEAAADLQDDSISMDPEGRERTLDIAESMQHVIRHSDRANRIISQMVSMSREEDAAFRPVPVNALVSEQAELAYAAAKALSPGCRTVMDKRLDPGAGDIGMLPEDISRVIVNLVTNAIQATEERAENGEDGEDYRPLVRVETARRGDGVAVTVHDNGAGMSQDTMNRMFNPFFTNRKDGAGTGLGLSLSYDIVKFHGGTIEVQSQEGSHTTMTVTLPAQPEARR